MKKALSLIVAVLLALPCFGFAFADDAVICDNSDIVGMSIAGFNTRDLYYNTVTSDVLQNSVVTIMNNWNIGCAPCYYEMPFFQQLFDEYSADPASNIQIFGVVGSPTSCKNYLESNGYSWTNLVQDSVLFDLFALTDSIPITIAVDRNGVIRDCHDSYFRSVDELREYAEGWRDTLLAEESGAVTPGDVDGDGRISIADAVLVLRVAMGIGELEGEQLARADVNGNGTVDVADAVTILRMAMGL